MACTDLTIFNIPCKEVGGVQKVWIGPYNPTGPLTYTLDPDGTIGTFSGATVSFTFFQQDIETANYNYPAEISDTNNAISYTQTLGITLPSMTQAVSNEVKILGQGRWRVIILDNNGNYWFMGFQGPVKISAIEGGLGQARVDGRKSVLTFVTKEDHPFKAVSAAAVASVINGQ